MRLPSCLRRTLFHFLFAPLLIAMAACLAVEPTKDSLETVRKNIADGKAVLVDVREKSEWDQGHVDGAVSMPISALQQNPETLAKSLPKDKIIYTHCVVGKRSVAAANLLEKYGYEVRPLKPGYRELINAGFKSAK